MREVSPNEGGGPAAPTRETLKWIIDTCEMARRLEKKIANARGFAVNNRDCLAAHPPSSGRRWPIPASPPPVILARVVTERKNYLRCQRWDIVNNVAIGSGYIYVAKPRMLQQVASHYPNISSLTSNTASRVTVSYTTWSEAWRIVAPYTSAIIWVMPVANSGVEIDEDDVGEATQYCRFIDMNTDSRRWVIG